MTAIPRACITCGRPSAPGGSRCELHGGGRGWDRYKARYPERAAQYRDPAWKTRRQAQLAADPTCAVCRRPATDADHVVAVSLGGSFDGSLQSLCRRCHLAKTARDSAESKRRAAERRNQ
jgi:5-methylcytosine-specific restriction endonuclease McrA